MTKRALQLIVSMALAAIFVWLIGRNLEVGEFKAVLGRADVSWIAVAMGLFLAGYACRIARWRSMLLRDNPTLAWTTCVVPFMGSIAANNVLPFRAGDVLRVYALSSHLQVSKSVLLASLLVERLLDLFSLLVAFSVCLLVFDLREDTAGRLVELGAYGVFALAMTILTLLLFPRLMEWPTMKLVRIMSMIWPSMHQRVGIFTNHLFAALHHLSNGPRMAILLLWSVFVWGFEGCVFWASAHAIPEIEQPLVGFLALPVSTLATLLPSTPGYVGTFDFFAVKSAEALGSSREAATAFAVLVHLILWLPASLIGGAGLALWSMKVRGRLPLKRGAKIPG